MNLSSLRVNKTSLYESHAIFNRLLKKCFMRKYTIYYVTQLFIYNIIPSDLESQKQMVVIRMSLHYVLS